VKAHDREETRSLAGLLTRRVGSAAVATFEQLLLAGLMFWCVLYDAWAQLVTLVLAAVFLVALRAPRE
jgi:hypothetical protein